MIGECNLPYGNGDLKIKFPPGIKIALLKSRHFDGVKDLATVITRSLKFPIGSLPLKERLNKGDKVAIIVTDNTRACPDDILLPPLLTEIEDKTSSENITIIIALGLHNLLSRDEMVKKLGHQIVDRYRVINHDIKDTVRIGVTSRGLPVEINRCVIESDFRISTGFIEPHFFAGFSGGRKSITPGVASLETIRANHSFKMIDHPDSRAGILEGNPIHEDMVEQSRMAKLNFILNVLMNEKHEISHVVAGDPIKAHEKGCELEKRVAGVKVDHKFDIVITTNSGAPLDLNLYQTCKGIENASRITRIGGIIIVAAACSSGVGPETFRTLHAFCNSPESVLEKIKGRASPEVQWQNQILARVQLANQIYLVSELHDQGVKEMMITPFKTVELALHKALEILGRESMIAVIPEGPLVLPNFKGI
jgi:lactate racemase